MNRQNSQTGTLAEIRAKSFLIASSILNVIGIVAMFLLIPAIYGAWPIFYPVIVMFPCVIVGCACSFLGFKIIRDSTKRG